MRGDPMVVLFSRSLATEHGLVRVLKHARILGWNMVGTWLENGWNLVGTWLESENLVGTWLQPG